MYGLNMSAGTKKWPLSRGGCLQRFNFISKNFQRVSSAGCKESHFYSLPFGKGEASIY